MISQEAIVWQKEGSHLYAGDVLIGNGSFYVGDTLIDSDNFMVGVGGYQSDIDVFRNARITLSGNIDTLLDVRRAPWRYINPGYARSFLRWPEIR